MSCLMHRVRKITERCPRLDHPSNIPQWFAHNSPQRKHKPNGESSRTHQEQRSFNQLWNRLSGFCVFVCPPVLGDSLLTHPLNTAARNRLLWPQLPINLSCSHYVKSENNKLPHSRSSQKGSAFRCRTLPRYA